MTFIHSWTLTLLGTAEGDGGTGQAGDKAVALRGGDAKTRRCGAVDDDREQRRAEARERHGAVSAKVDDM